MSLPLGLQSVPIRQMPLPGPAIPTSGTIVASYIPFAPFKPQNLVEQRKSAWRNGNGVASVAVGAIGSGVPVLEHIRLKHVVLSTRTLPGVGCQTQVPRPSQADKLHTWMEPQRVSGGLG